LSLIRQLLATGVLNMSNPFNDAVIFDITIIPADFTIPMFSSPIGAFLTFALLAAGIAAINNRDQKKVKGA
jgi:electron transport complex protein RnfE